MDLCNEMDKNTRPLMYATTYFVSESINAITEYTKTKKQRHDHHILIPNSITETSLEQTLEDLSSYATFTVRNTATAPTPAIVATGTATVTATAIATVTAIVTATVIIVVPATDCYCYCSCDYYWYSYWLNLLLR